MMRIYCSQVETTNIDGEYQLVEVNECEYGEEWDGNVAGYVFSAIEDWDEYTLIENPDLGNIHHGVMVSNEGPENVVMLVRKDGTPVEVYWA